MSYRVELTTAAARQIKKLPRPARDRILDAVANLAGDPRPRGAKKLAGEETAWRIRVGDYRVIYDVFDSELVVTVVRAGHRREVYDR
ncbi:type II toxin-antitoxin system RelE family toxin [Microbacterium schleiferi]|uniref:Type II toxin-antitoxin system RelE/ParE family toxin n=1 Tax=Microbacterium schleiferi TaxID=69362 RepID=A0ABU7V4T4_9MICO|nr:type II toxin-antitoxin system RelE/ParE family toxin [Micrococcales bacterium]